MSYLKCWTWSFEKKRQFFILVNAIFLVIGVSSLSVGVWLYMEKNDFLELTPSSFSSLSAAGLCAFSGAVIAIISVIGCISVTMGTRCLLCSYIIFICIMCILQSVTGFTKLFYKDSTREKIRTDMYGNINRTVAHTVSGRTVYLQVSWDHLQESLECCGVDGPADWYQTSQWPKNNFVPDSCCDPSLFKNREVMSNCGKVGVKNAHWFKQGCYEVFADWLFHHVHVVFVLSLVLLCAEAVVLFAGILVYMELGKMKKEKRNTLESVHYSRGADGEGEGLHRYNEDDE